MRARLLALAVLLAPVASARAQATCDGGSCQCTSSTACSCNAGCSLQCVTGVCTLGAEGGASVLCREGTRCTVGVAGPLQLTCDEAARCTGTGGPGSTVVCLDQSCAVTLASGSVQCSNNLGTSCQVTCLGSCDVTCAGRGTCPLSCVAGARVQCGNDISACGLCPDGGTGVADAGPDVPRTRWQLGVGCTSGWGAAPWALLPVGLGFGLRRRRR
jgi:hypothetical protein